MNKNKKIKLIKFDKAFFDVYPKSLQIEYLYGYLKDLGAKTILVEDNYFDRDYLSEFSAFYGISTKGYENICKRIHYFSESFKKNTFRRAVGGGPVSSKKIKESYLGFTVIRPIEGAVLGRTVLRHYKDTIPSTPRITRSSRVYKCHVAGLELEIEGLAWQQQDTAVGACATIGLWTLFHSSAFDDHHAIPTTAEITNAANKSTPSGKKAFPSEGLNIIQLCEAIKAQDLAPVVIEGDVQISLSDIDSKCPEHNISSFSKVRYSVNCASFLRSGYPVILYGNLIDINGNYVGCHAICVTGFRDKPSPKLPINNLYYQDAEIEYQYIHDDNIGPNVRFKINEFKKTGSVYLQTDTPPDATGAVRTNSPTKDYPLFFPWAIIVATHEDLRSSPNILIEKGIEKAGKLLLSLNTLLVKNRHTPIALYIGARFIKLSDYFGQELGDTIDSSPKILSNVRMALIENVSPMSLHIGVIRIALEDSSPMMDILYDTTDSRINHPIYAHIDYAQMITQAVHLSKEDFGIEIKAY